VIVRTEVLDVAVAVSCEQHAHLFTLPAAHDELIIADALVAPLDKFVAFRDQQESVFTVKVRDTCEGLLSSIGGDPFSEEGLTYLPFRGSPPFSYVQNQHAVRSKRPCKCCEDRVASVVVDDVIEDAPAQYCRISSIGLGKAMSATANDTPPPSPTAWLWATLNFWSSDEP
jgi:hypothetical protein